LVTFALSRKQISSSLVSKWQFYCLLAENSTEGMWPEIGRLRPDKSDTGCGSKWQ